MQAYLYERLGRFDDAEQTYQEAARATTVSRL
jgi:hypothetical protein